MERLYTVLLLLILTFNTLKGANDQDTAHIDIQHYSFKIVITDQTDQIRGTTDILLRLKNANTEEIILDLVGLNSRTDGKGMKVLKVSKDGRSLDFTHKSNKLNIFLNELTTKDQLINLTITYEGIPADGLIISKNKYGDRTFFGDNWPNRARHWFPGIDHPSDKATCEFIITSPAHYQVIANGILREESNVKVGMSNEELKITHWVNRVPIATKVMVFGAARFAILHADQFNNIPVEHWVYPEDREAGFSDFEPALNILQYYHQQISPYPYEKLANVQSSTNYGGMENASNIFYDENIINGKNNMESLLAHEIAHQWFGNSVTEADWSHIWLSEGFATYFTHLYIEHTYGRDSMIARLKEDKEHIFSYYLKSSETAVIDTLTTNLFKLLNANAYQKGSWFLHMLRYQLGDDTFWKGIRNYYTKYQNGNVDTDDFRMMMEETSGKNLTTFFHQWLENPGHPYVKGMWKYSGFGKKLSIHVEQAQENGILYDMEIQIAVHYKNVVQPEIHTLKINKKTHKIELKLKKSPRAVIIDPNNWLLMDYIFEEA